MKKTIIQVESEISTISKDNPCLADRVKALGTAGYNDNINILSFEYPIGKRSLNTLLIGGREYY